MFLLQIARAPFIMHLANEQGQPAYEIHVPKYTLGEAIGWGAVLTERWRATQTQNLNDIQRREFDTMYPQIPATLTDIKRAVASLEGAEEVIRISIPKAKVFAVEPQRKVVKTTEMVKTTEKDSKLAIRSAIIWKRGREITEPGFLDKVLDQILAGNGSGTLNALAWELSDLNDTSDMTPSQKADPENDDEEAAAPDPLK